MKTFSSGEINLRGLLYVSIAMIGFLLGDEWFREAMPKWVFTLLGCSSAGLIAFRCFIDTSTTQTNKPLEVINPPDQPLEVQTSDEIEPDSAIGEEAPKTATPSPLAHAVQTNRRQEAAKIIGSDLRNVQ